MKPLRTVLSAVTLLALLQPLRAQQDHGSFVEHLSVNLVTVDVVVEDRQGNPVHGLDAADFSVLEDGRPVSVSHFREVRTSPATRSPGTMLAQPTATAPIPSVVANHDRSPLHVVIYVDDANLHPLNRRKVVPQLKTWMGQLPGHARVMLVRAFRSADVVLPFTTNHNRVSTELESLTTAAGGRGQVAAGRQELLNDLYSEKEEALLRSEVFAYADSMHDDVARSLQTLSSVVDELSGLPGRKVLLYVNDGISIRPGEELFEVLEEQFDDSVSRMRALDYDLSRDFMRLSQRAAAARIAISSVDAAGLRPPSNADVTAYRAARSSFADSVYLANLQEPLQMMAHETGGRAITNTNLISNGLRRVSSALSNYYELAYASPPSGSGRFRRIEVSVSSPDGSKLRVYHRRGYRDVDGGRRIEAEVRAALSFGYAANPMGLSLSTQATANGSAGNTSTVPLQITLPLDKLTLLPSNDSTSNGRVTLFIGVRDEDGRFSPVERFDHSISIPTAALKQSPDASYRLQHTVQMRSGHQSLAVAVRDDLSAQHSIVLGAIDA